MVRGRGESVSKMRWWEPLRQIAVAAATGRKPASPGLLVKLAVVFCAAVGIYDVVAIILFLSGGPYIGSCYAYPS